MTVWRNVHVGIEDDGLGIEGLEVWKHAWRRTSEPPLDHPHPSYPDQMHRYGIYEIGAPKHPVRFAAAELSNGVWAFCVPEMADGGLPDPLRPAERRTGGDADEPAGLPGYAGGEPETGRELQLAGVLRLWLMPLGPELTLRPFFAGSCFPTLSASIASKAGGKLPKTRLCGAILFAWPRPNHSICQHSCSRTSTGWTLDQFCSTRDQRGFDLKSE